MSPAARRRGVPRRSPTRRSRGKMRPSRPSSRRSWRRRSRLSTVRSASSDGGTSTQLQRARGADVTERDRAVVQLDQAQVIAPLLLADGARGASAHRPLIHPLRVTTPAAAPPQLRHLPAAHAAGECRPLDHHAHPLRLTPLRQAGNFSPRGGLQRRGRQHRAQHVAGEVARLRGIVGALRAEERVQHAALRVPALERRARVGEAAVDLARRAPRGRRPDRRRRDSTRPTWPAQPSPRSKNTTSPARASAVAPPCPCRAGSRAARRACRRCRSGGRARAARARPARRPAWRADSGASPWRAAGGRHWARTCARADASCAPAHRNRRARRAPRREPSHRRRS